MSLPAWTFGVNRPNDVVPSSTTVVFKSLLNEDRSSDFCVLALRRIDHQACGEGAGRDVTLCATCPGSQAAPS
jgi:hypothetical protein